ncbi:MAG: heme ABC exporter ATP-binding protein CcmA [Chloroflexota bacterium]
MSLSTPLIAVNGLVKAFGLRPVLRDINFEVASGAVMGLLGPNGSGKTTLLRLLSGLSKATAGTITIGGWSLPDEAAAVRMQIGVVAHLPLLYDDLTAEENLRFFARLYNLDNAHSQERVATMLDRVGLAKRSRELVHTFSRGMQQRLAIARAMLHEPAVLLLDEPYTGLDVSGAELLDGLIRDWKVSGRTLIISLHDLQRASAISDQIVILNRGKVAVNSPVAEIDNLPSLFAQVTDSA